MPPDPAVLQEWAEAAPFWEHHRDLIGHMFAPVTHALVEATRISPGQTILDLATGPGDPALSLAPLVGPTGTVIGLDPVPAMIAAARREATRLALPSIRFEVAAADNLPFPDNTFHTALSRFGIMFFPDPLAATREILRVLQPGGTLAFAVWHSLDQNPFFTVVERILQSYLPQTPADPDAPNSFRFAIPGKLRDILLESGVESPSERLLKFTMDVPIQPEDFWALRHEMSDKLRGSLAKLSSAQLSEVKHRALRDVAAFATPTGLTFPAEVLILSAKKSF